MNAPVNSVPGTLRDRQPPSPDPRHHDADSFVADVEPDRLPPGDWPALRSVPVCVLVPVKNEERNIVECLRHVRWAKHLVVVDSQSTDRTIPLAQAMGADVYQFYIDRAGWPKKRNWALDNISWPCDWVLIMDADEHMTPELTSEVEQVVTGNYRFESDDAKGCGDGYWLNRRFMFMGRWLKHCGYYPSWNVRLLKHWAGRYERIGQLGESGSGDNEVHEHIVLKTGRAGFLKSDFLHYAYPDLKTWVEKHNRYTSWEAHVMMNQNAGELEGNLWGSPIERRRWIKSAAQKLPCRPTLRFLYTYVFSLGFLDGYPGFVMARLMAWYEFMSLAKYRELRWHEKNDGEAVP